MTLQKRNIHTLANDVMVFPASFLPSNHQVRVPLTILLCAPRDRKRWLRRRPQTQLTARGVPRIVQLSPGLALQRHNPQQYGGGKALPLRIESLCVGWKGDKTLQVRRPKTLTRGASSHYCRIGRHYLSLNDLKACEDPHAVTSS